jgi:hypothetical protein
MRRVGSGRNGKTLRLTPAQGGYTDVHGFVRAGNEHSNASVKTDRIMNSKYRGRLTTKTGWDVLKAAAFFCAHKRAANYSIEGSSSRDLSIFEGFDVLDRQAIADEADALYELVKARFQDMHPPQDGQRARPHRAVARVEVAPRRVGGARAERVEEIAAVSDSDDETDEAASDSIASDEDAHDQSESSDGNESMSEDEPDDNMWHFFGEARRIAGGRAAREAHANAIAQADDAFVPIVGQQCRWDSPLGRMFFDVKIVSLDLEDRTATFEYLPPYDFYAQDTRTLNEFRPNQNNDAGVGQKRRRNPRF